MKRELHHLSYRHRMMIIDFIETLLIGVLHIHYANGKKETFCAVCYTIEDAFFSLTDRVSFTIQEMVHSMVKIYLRNIDQEYHGTLPEFEFENSDVSSNTRFLSADFYPMMTIRIREETFFPQGQMTMILRYMSQLLEQGERPRNHQIIEHAVNMALRIITAFSRIIRAIREGRTLTEPMMINAQQISENDARALDDSTIPGWYGRHEKEEDERNRHNLRALRTSEVEKTYGSMNRLGAPTTRDDEDPLPSHRNDSAPPTILGRTDYDRVLAVIDSIGSTGMTSTLFRLNPPLPQREPASSNTFDQMMAGIVPAHMTQAPPAPTTCEPRRPTGNPAIPGMLPVQVPLNPAVPQNEPASSNTFDQMMAGIIPAHMTQAPPAPTTCEPRRPTGNPTIPGMLPVPSTSETAEPLPPPTIRQPEVSGPSRFDRMLEAIKKSLTGVRPAAVDLSSTSPAKPMFIDYTAKIQCRPTPATSAFIPPLPPASDPPNTFRQPFPPATPRQAAQNRAHPYVRFSQEHMDILERDFAERRGTISRCRLRELAERMGVDLEQVKSWYETRRKTDRKSERNARRL